MYNEIKNPFIFRLKCLEFVESADFDIVEQFFDVIKGKETGGFILNEGVDQKKIFFVMEGWGIKYKGLIDGGRQILNFVLPGDIVGIYSPIFSCSEHSVEAITAMKVGSLASEKLLDIFRSSPRLALAMTWMAGQDERILEEQIVRIGRRRAAKRMAHLLVELYRRLRLCGYTQDEAAKLPLNQLILSDALGLSHIHAHRVFGELIRMRMIDRTSGQILLKDRALLASLADFDASYLEPANLNKVAQKL